MNKILPVDALWYLLESGAIKSISDIVLKRYSVIRAGNRNLATIVVPHDEKETGYLIKQARNENSHSIKNEILFYELFSNTPELNQYIVKFIHADNGRHVFVLEYIRNSLNMSAYFSKLLSNGGEEPIRDVSCELGKALFRCSDIMNMHLRHFGDISQLARAQPPVLKYFSRRFAYSEDQAKGQSEVIQLINKYEVFIHAAEEASKSWKINSIIHCDMKFENIIFDEKHGTIKIIDWELMGLGDSAWDIAGILQSYFRIWAVAIHGEPTRHAGFTMIVSGIRAFWRGYKEACHHPVGITKFILEKSIRYAGIRLVQSCYEAEAKSDALRPTTWTLMQISMNLLSRPEEFIGLIEDDENIN